MQWLWYLRIHSTLQSTAQLTAEYDCNCRASNYHKQYSCSTYLGTLLFIQVPYYSYNRYLTTLTIGTLNTHNTRYHTHSQRHPRNHCKTTTKTHSTPSAKYTSTRASLACKRASLPPSSEKDPKTLLELYFRYFIIYL